MDFAPCICIDGQQEHNLRGLDMNKLITVILATMLIAGCASQGYNLNGGESIGVSPDHQQSQHFFVSGIGQEKNIDVAALCGGADKVLRVESQETATNVLIGFVTFGIYTPRDAKVFCKK